MMSWGGDATDTTNEDEQPSPQQLQPAYQQPSLQSALGGALAANPVTGSGGGQPNQPQNPEWQQPQPEHPQQSGGLLERGLSAASNFLGQQSIPAVGPALSLVYEGLGQLGVNTPNLGTLGGVFEAQNQAMGQYGQALNQVPGYSSLPAPVQSGFQALPYAALPGGVEGLAPRLATAFGSGVAGYGAQQGAAQLGAGPVTQQAAGLLGGIGTYEAAGALDRVDPLAGIQSPQAAPDVTRLGTEEPRTLYRGNQTGQPGSWWSTSPDYAQTYGGPTQAAALGAHPLETLDVTTPQGRAILGNSLDQAYPQHAVSNARMIASMAPDGTMQGMSLQLDSMPELRSVLADQGYRAVKVGPDWSGGGLRPGENADAYYMLDKSAPTQVTAPTGAPAPEPMGTFHPVETSTTGPIPTTPTTGAYPPPESFVNADHQRGYYQGLLDSQQLAPHDFSPTRGPDDGDFQMGYKEGRLGIPPGQLVNAPMNVGSDLTQPLNEAIQGNAQVIGSGQQQPPATNVSSGVSNNTGYVGGPLPNSSPMSPQQAIQVQQAAQQGWMQQPGTNPYQPPSGGQPPRGNVPTGNTGGIDWNPIHNAFAAIGAPTQPLLTGLHLARFAPQELFRPSVLGNGLRAMGEAALTGKVDQVSAHVNNDFGPNVPQGLRPADMKAIAGNPHVDPTAVQYMINHTPVIGPVLERFRAVNSALLGTMRDAHYLVEADKIARSDPGAGPEVYQNLWREANNATGHQTLIGNPDALNVSQGMGVGWSAALARVQELGNLVWGTGAPLPWAAGSRGAAFRSMMGVTAAMAGTTMLGKALGAQVNTDEPFNKFGVDTSFLRPVTNNGLYKSVYGLNGAGYDTLIKGAANIGYHLFNGDEKGALNAALAFGRGEFGVVPSAVIDGILGQDWKGDKYTWENFINEAKTGFFGDKNGQFPSLEGRSVPIPAADIGKAVEAYGPGGALRAAPAAIASTVSTTPLNTTSQAFKYAAPPDIVQKAGLPLATQGLDWNELLPTEKAAITRTLGDSNPQLLQQIQANSRQQYPASAAHNDAVDALTTRKTAAEDRILDLYNAGSLDKKATVNAMRAVQSDYYTNKAKVDADPSYQAETANLRSADRTDAQKALDAFYAIGNNFTNKTERQQEQAKYIQWLNGQDPKLAERIVNAVQPHNQTKLEAMYAAGAFN